jgi:hypothetical protein
VASLIPDIATFERCPLLRRLVGPKRKCRERALSVKRSHLLSALRRKTEFAGRGEGDPEYLIEVPFVAVPAEAGADIILRAERMLDATRRQGGEAFNPTS